VFERLRSGPLSVGEIARDMPVSRPAVSQHLAVLKEAGLVVDRPVGDAAGLLYTIPRAQRVARLVRSILGSDPRILPGRGRAQHSDREGEEALSLTVTIAPVRKSVVVKVDAARAF